MTPLLHQSFAIFYDNLHWTQEKLDEQLKNFSRTTSVDSQNECDTHHVKNMNRYFF